MSDQNNKPQKRDHTNAFFPLVSGVFTVSKNSTINKFWNNAQRSGISHDGYMFNSEEAQKGGFYKSTDLRLVFFGPNGGSHETLKPGDKIKVTNADLIFRIRKILNKSDRDNIKNGIENVQADENSKKTAVGAMYNGNIIVEIKADETQWEIYTPKDKEPSVDNTSMPQNMNNNGNQEEATGNTEALKGNPFT